MIGLIHKFLIYAPGAVVTLIIAAAGVWDGLRDRISVAAGNTVIAMGNPIVAILCIALISIYVAAIFFTNDGGDKAAEARAKAAAEKVRARRHLVTVGRSLAGGYINSHGQRTLLEFMQEDSGYARLRPHFSRSFSALLASNAVDRQSMHMALLNEMDRLERRWRLI